MKTAPRKSQKRPKAAAPDPIAVRAQQATDLKYGPELAALKQLGQEAQESYLAGAGQARAAANAIVAQANASSGGLADFLARAGQRGQATLAKVAPVAAGISNEGQLAARNHGLTAESAAAQLAQTKVRAQQAGSYQQANLYGAYKSDLGKINSQAAALAGQAGDYAKAVYQSLLDDKSANDLKARQIAQSAKNAALQRGTQRLLAGIDQNGRVIAGSPKATSLDIQQQNATTASNNAADRKAAAAAKAKEKKAKDAAAKSKGTYLPLAQQNAYINSIKAVAARVKRDLNSIAPEDVKDSAGIVVVKKGGRLTSSAMRRLLADGTGPNNRPVDPDVINSAFDLALLGGLSPLNHKRVNQAGVKIGGRIPTAKNKKPRPSAPFGIG